MKGFNATGNKVKTEEYLSITNTQLKKLKSDAQIQIINIRGYGYKLVY